MIGCLCSCQAQQNKKARDEDLNMESITDSVKSSPAVASDIKSIPLVSPNRRAESSDSTLNQASNIINSLLTPVKNIYFHLPEASCSSTPNIYSSFFKVGCTVPLSCRSH